ncbi:putative transporter y4wD [Asanoa ishikariensis]|uniref:Fucose permease n=1 Tax=Asanoa ishikariensis TaxID=137265 RepID=A0A1H3UMH2_9ACTN|nr:MFS transporter [Asanoa ishikariensis]GIF69917.1 putative transporter y4wD [Asanoa ishikariensis]SDZ63537.1 Fucose permease [Asanoa ishikariensis]
MTAAFGLAGALCGVLTARIPALMDEHAISPSQLGGVLFLWGLGAVVSTQALRWVMARTGSAPVLRVAAPAYAMALALVACAPTYGTLLAAVTVFGMGLGAVDVAANSQGSATERAYGRPIVAGIHAGWPVGAGAGGLIAAFCAHLGVPYTQTLVGAAVLALPVAVVLGRTLLHTRPPPLAGRTRGRTRPVVYGLGVIAFSALAIEVAVTDWTGVLLHGGLGTSQAVAALAYPMFQAGLLTGRVVADRLRTRLGARAVLVWAGALTAGFLAVTSASQALVVLAGIYGVGVAISPVLPLAFSLAGSSDAQSSDAVIAQLGVIAYAGVLASPAMIGVLAGASTLRLALVVVAVALGAAIVLAGLLLPIDRADARLRVGGLPQQARRVSAPSTLSAGAPSVSPATRPARQGERRVRRQG